MTCSTVLNLIADRTIKGRIYPSLSKHEARPYTQSWREFGQHWPYTTPLRIEEYCRQHEVKLNVFDINSEFPTDTYYPVCLGFFDFNIDYFELLSESVFSAVAQRRLRVLFMYHEGDNPRRIKNRLDILVKQHLLPEDAYVFVSANTSADALPGFVTFHDFELWYYQRNIDTPALPTHNTNRERDFTALVRLHKSWRAAAVTDLKRQSILDNSYWSYCETGELDADCPIEIDTLSQLRWATNNFLKSAPYVSDELDQAERNDHSITEPKYYINSYCNIVLESQFDVDQSGGAFITEKTFKPIKHGQLFFIAGGQGSLQALRDLGYRVFDGLLDNSYDLEHNHTMRWIKLTEAIAQAKTNLPNLYAKAQTDIDYNQQLFVANKAQRLNTLIEKIHEQHR